MVRYFIRSGYILFRMQRMVLTIDSPYVILNDFGGAFAMGAIGGGIWHGIKGARNSPRVSEPPIPSHPLLALSNCLHHEDRNRLSLD
jgi:hypothetical protein